jgi:arylsulfatase A-like enzyme
VHLTDQFIRSAARQHRPFFAYLSVYAPHQPATPAPRDLRSFPRARAPRTASFNQADVSRAPGYVRDLPQFSLEETRAIDSLYRKRIRSLQAVDRGMVRLVNTLRATKELDRTYIVFASDNGFHLGQHRMPAGKQTPYETDIHVPLIVRGPAVQANAHVSRLAGNTDLAPTFDAMAGVRPPSFTDGRSLVPLLRGVTPRHWRRSYLIEHRMESGMPQPARSLSTHNSTLEPPDPDQAGSDGHARHREIRDAMLLNRGAEIPDYQALRTAHLIYAQYATGDKELFDLRRDPDEIDNLAGTRPHLEHRMALRIARLGRCGGQGCRVVENEPLRPAPALEAAATMRSLR